MKKLPEKTSKLITKLYEKGFSPAQIARKVNISYSCAYAYTVLKDEGFKSYTEYQEDLAVKKGFKSLTEYNEDLALKKGFNSLHEYNEDLAVKKGFKSLTEYNEDLARKRQKRKQNKTLSALIKKRLNELGKNQSWLSEGLGINESTVSRYISGRTTPSNSNLEKIISILNLNNKTIEDLLE